MRGNSGVAMPGHLEHCNISLRVAFGLERGAERGETSGRG